MGDTEVLNKDTVMEEQKQEERLNELYEKKDLTDEEKREFTELKTGRKDRYQKRLDKMKSETLAARHEAEQERQKREAAENKAAELEAKEKAKIARSIDETVEIDGKHYPTDRALKSMVDAGEITDEEAFQRQDERKEAAIVAKTVNRIRNEDQQTESQKIRQQDFDEVLKTYPHFNKNHPDFNPGDELYKEVNRLWQNGYSANPKGLSMAVQDAKRILRITDRTPDISDDLSLRSGNPPSARGKEKEITMTEHEQEFAVNMYRNSINPKTGKTYTPDEAIAKAKKAKERQMASRRV